MEAEYQVFLVHSWDSQKSMGAKAPIAPMLTGSLYIYFDTIHTFLQVTIDWPKSHGLDETCDESLNLAYDDCYLGVSDF